MNFENEKISLVEKIIFTIEYFKIFLNDSISDNYDFDSTEEDIII